MKVSWYSVLTATGGLLVAAFLAGTIDLRASAGHDLTEAELLNTYGREECYDCDDVEERHDCDAIFKGCKNGTIGCGLYAMVGTGNIRHVCVTNDEPIALCKQKDDILCEKAYHQSSGTPQENMNCSEVSWNCVSGDTRCWECYKGEHDPSMDEDIEDYECPVEES